MDVRSSLGIGDAPGTACRKNRPRKTNRLVAGAPVYRLATKVSLMADRVRTDPLANHSANGTAPGLALSSYFGLSVKNPFFPSATFPWLSPYRSRSAR